MATYNGERFLVEQIESILKQNYTHIKLVIRDDGSSDGTIPIIRKFVEQYPDKIRLLNDCVGNVGSTANFFRLIESSNADYVMLSDQDDVWLTDKVALTMDVMAQTEEALGRSTPVLVHTDLKVTDKSLSVVSDSLWKHQKISPDCNGVNRLLVQNVVTGCTVMINRSLINLLRPYSIGIIEHDWWLALLAASFGKVAYVSKPTILYRQHGKNAVGAVKWSFLGGVRRFFAIDSTGVFNSLERTRVQAALFFRIYRRQLSPNMRRMIWRYSTLHKLGYFLRIACVVRCRFFKIGVLRNIGMILGLMKSAP